MSSFVDHTVIKPLRYSASQAPSIVLWLHCVRNHANIDCLFILSTAPQKHFLY